MKDEKYFNFPVQLLEGFLIDSDTCLKNIRDYAVYAHSQNLELGSELATMKSAAAFFGVTLKDILHSYHNGLRLFESVPEKSPKSGISVKIFFNFYETDKSEFEKVCLLSFLAIKSILQGKAYCKTVNKYLLSRMDGRAKSVSELEELSDEVRRYGNEYQIKKIKTELRNNWGLVTYSRYTRGFYVSFKLNLEDLVFQAEKRRKSSLEKQYKQKEREALRMALEKLEN